MAFEHQDTDDRGTAPGGGRSERSILDADDGHHCLEDLIQAQSSNKPINKILAELGTPFVSVGILENGRITAKIIGASNARNSTLDNETLFQAASISKPLTAMAVVKLCQQGKLDLDAPISEYLNNDQLSWISTPKTLPLVSQITLRHLLSHTSGLSCRGFMGYPTSEVPTIEQTLRGENPANNENITMKFLPGQEFHYSGGGFTVVQFILETRLGEPFPDIMDRVLFVPLNMVNSTFGFLSEEDKNYASAHINGTTISNPEYHFLPESAAAGLWTTPSDLLKVVQAMQKSLESDDFLEKRWAREMLREVGGLGRGLGWRAKKGEVQFGHAGSNDPGYLCYVGGYAALPTEDEGNEQKKSIPKDSGFCVMTSSMLGMKIIEKVAAAIAYLEEWPTIPELESVPFMDRGKVIDQGAREWCGKWGPGDWTLSHDDGEMFCVQFGKLRAMSLVTAAIPTRKYEEGNSIDLVVDGLEVMLRLGWKDKARIVEVWQEGGISTLEQSQ